jgi:hypothetical protein
LPIRPIRQAANGDRSEGDCCVAGWIGHNTKHAPILIVLAMRTVGTSNCTTSLNSPAPRTSAGSKRRSSHIFGEYCLLKDSRYTSQVNSTGT